MKKLGIALLILALAAPCIGILPSFARAEDALAGLEIREDIRSAMRASGALSGVSFNRAADGGFYFEDRRLRYAYAYYGEPVAALYADEDSRNVLALMEDGRVYNGTTLVTGDVCVRDVSWSSDSASDDAFMLGRDGGAYYYDPYDANRFEACPGTGPCSAVCRSTLFPLYFLRDGGVWGYGWPYRGAGGAKGLSEEDLEYWSAAQNIVVGACIAQPDGRFDTIAGISADGTVYATGRYADQILDMGPLSYIAADAVREVFVGLTPEGELKAVGHYADYLNPSGTRVTGMRLLNGTLWYVDAEGIVYEDSLYFDDRLGRYTPEGTDAGYRTRRMGGDGSVYGVQVEYDKEEDGLVHYRPVDLVNASAGDRDQLLIYLELLDRRLEYSTEVATDTREIDKDARLALVDLDGDGAWELVIDGDTTMGIARLYNGKLTHVDHLIPTKYCPEAKLLAGTNPVDYGYGEDYCQFRGGVLTALVNRYDGEDAPEAEYCLFTSASELPLLDAEGDALRARPGFENRISEGEFEAYLASLLGGNALRDFEPAWFGLDQASLAAALLGPRKPAHYATAADAPEEADRAPEGAGAADADASEGDGAPPLWDIAIQEGGEVPGGEVDFAGPVRTLFAGGTNELLAVNAEGGVNGTGILQPDRQFLAQSQSWEDVVSIQLSGKRLVALRSDGTVCEADGYSRQEDLSPALWRDLVKVVCAGSAVAGLRADGTVVCEGISVADATRDGQLVQRGFDQAAWTDIVDVALCEDAVVGLRGDGTLIYAGEMNENRDDLLNWRDIRRICATRGAIAGIDVHGRVHAVGPVAQALEGWIGIQELYPSNDGSSFCGVRTNGTVVTTLTDPSVGALWSDVIKVAWGNKQLAALTADGRVLTQSTLGVDSPFDTGDWSGMVDLYLGNCFIVGLREDGSLAVDEIPEERGEAPAYIINAGHWKLATEGAAGKIIGAGSRRASDGGVVGKAAGIDLSSIETMLHGNDDVIIVTVEPFIGTQDTGRKEPRSAETPICVGEISALAMKGNLPSLKTFRLYGREVSRKGVKNLFDGTEDIDVLIWHGHGGYDDFREQIGPVLDLREGYYDVDALTELADFLKRQSHYPVLQNAGGLVDFIAELVAVLKNAGDLVENVFEKYDARSLISELNNTLDMIPDFLLDEEEREMLRDLLYFSPTKEWDGWHAAINRYFVEDYVDMDEGLVYLATCSSGETEELANAFHENGAEVVVFNKGSEQIDNGYDLNCMHSFFNYLTGNGVMMSDGMLTQNVDPICYTAAEAMEKTREYMKAQTLAWGIATEETYRDRSYAYNEDTNEVIYHDAYPKLSSLSDEDYTLFGAIAGTMTSPDGSVDLDEVKVTLQGTDVEGVKVRLSPDEQDFVDFYLQGLKPGSYTVEFWYKGKALEHRRDIEVDRHHRTALDSVVELYQTKRVTGTVTDRQTGEKLIGALVECYCPEKGWTIDAYTDGDGFYWIEDLRGGEYTLTATCSGYERQDCALSVDPRDEEELVRDFQLEPWLTELAPYFGRDLRDTAKRLGDLAYESGRAEDFSWERFYSDRVELLGTVGQWGSAIDWITLRGGPSQYTLFGIGVGMSRAEAMERMRRYERVEDYGDSGYATWCIEWDGVYYSTVVTVHFAGDAVSGVIYGWYGN